MKLNLVLSAFLFTFTTSSFAFTLEHVQDHSVVFLDQNGTDPRVPQTSRAYPFSAIGKLETSLSGGMGSSCTGTLVGRSILLTAAHCVLNENGGSASSVVFYPNVINNTAAGSANIVAVTVGTHQVDQDMANDWAVAYLDQPLGDKLGWLGVSPVGKSFPLAVTDVGYSNDFQNTDTAGMVDCFIVGQYDVGSYANSCSYNPGASGGPLFTQGRDGKAFVVGVATRAAHDETFQGFNPGAASMSVMNSDLIQTVQEYQRKYDQNQARPW